MSYCPTLPPECHTAPKCFHAMAALCGRAVGLWQMNIRRMGSTSGVKLRILPSATCLFDEAVQVKLDGLLPRQQVQFWSSHKDDKGVMFSATATYQADEGGQVDLARDPSLGGSYTGVEPMGLFWSMMPESPHQKLLKKDASSPVHIHIEARSDGQVLTTETAERHFLADGVRRVPVRDGRLRGTLFIPPGEGSFPGVLDLYTIGGVICEPRAALLANKGYVVFALAYYRYQDMPKTLDKVDLEYFEEALTFLQSQPEVKKTGVGLISISKSGDIALSIASLLPNVSATVCINACNASSMVPLHYKDLVIPAFKPDKKKIVVLPSGVLDVRATLPDLMEEEHRASIIPIERAAGSFMFIVSGDDWNWNSARFAELASSRLQEHGRKRPEILNYPNVGHFIEFPFMPFYPFGVHAVVGQVVAFGGEAKATADAQVDSWRRIQEFFSKHLKHEAPQLKSLF